MFVLILVHGKRWGSMKEKWKISNGIKIYGTGTGRELDWLVECMCRRMKLNNSLCVQELNIEDLGSLFC